MSTTSGNLSVRSREGQVLAGRVLVSSPRPSFRSCIGWSVARRETLCGATFRAGTYRCEACAAGYYAVGDGTCGACPVVRTLWDRYNGLFELLAAIVAAVTLLYCLLAVAVWWVGGTLAGGAQRLIQVCVRFHGYLSHLLVRRTSPPHPSHTQTIIWAVLTAQVFSQVGNTATPGLPAILQGVYRAAAALQVRVTVMGRGDSGVTVSSLPFTSPFSSRASYCLQRALPDLTPSQPRPSS